MLSVPLFTTQEVAELLKVSEATVRSWIKNQELRAVKFEREFRVAKVDLESFLSTKSTIKKADNA